MGGTADYPLMPLGPGFSGAGVAGSGQRLVVDTPFDALPVTTRKLAVPQLRGPGQSLRTYRVHDLDPRRLLGRRFAGNHGVIHGRYFFLHS